jgi:hypothetical protein
MAGQTTDDDMDSTCAMYPRYLRLQIHTQVVHYLLLFHCKNGTMNVPQCYIIHTLPVVFIIHS